MDIEYLLWLQNLREASNNVLTPFMQGVSDFAVGSLLLVPIFIYWCINKRNGLFVIASYGLSEFINAVVKLTACVYRPWIRDARIIPAGNAIQSAVGYSFPSGHTMAAAPTYGALGVLGRKKSFLIPLICGLAILTTMLSRNYLGVHTPQDVGVGMILGLFSVYIASKTFAYLGKHSEKENYFICAGLLLCVIALIYINFKSYPMDYIDGKLIVDPKKMFPDSFGDIGYFAGVLAGRYIEKNFVKFSSTGLNFKGILFAVIGLVIYELIHQYFRVYIRQCLGSDWGNLVAKFLMSFFAVAVWPIVLKKFK